MKTGKIVGMLGAVAAGAVIGLLFAPDKGSETRKKRSSKGKDLAETLKSILRGAEDDNTTATKEAEEPAGPLVYTFHHADDKAEKVVHQN